MSLNLATLLQTSAHATPDAPALTIGPRTLSYATLDGHARRFASALRRLGVRPGQHVALLLPNVPQFTIAYYGAHTRRLPGGAAQRAGHRAGGGSATSTTPTRPCSSPGRASWRPRNRASTAWPTASSLIVARADATDTSAPAGAESFTALVGGSDPVDDHHTTMPDDTAVILYTSGTTGKPKGAELTHFNMFYNADYVRTDLLKVQAGDVALATLPLFHSFGQTVVQNGMLSTGGHVVLLPRFTPDDAFGLMARHGVTLFAGVPTMYFALLHHPGADAYDLSSLRLCVSGGSAMPVEVMRAFDDKYGVNILEGYGLSETSPVASFNRLDVPKKAGSIGLPIRGVQFRLEDDQGGVVRDVDTPGEICIKGHNVMRGYYKRPEATAEAIRDGWFHSGDIGIVDADGYYRIVDRKKDMILRGGFNVYPREVEEVLYAHPAIGEAAVVGVPHDSHGEEVHAVVACKPGKTVTADEVVAWCKEQLAAYKYPRVVHVRDSLPKGPTGKILKRVLRDELVGA
ncbi:MAG: long-chain fatty acid--CoA ligase [Alphaproteobacteria bacterium]|nr:long-chain fatty acid--CoA ligase [Alphaproteobacteria bacterium]